MPKATVKIIIKPFNDPFSLVGSPRQIRPFDIEDGGDPAGRVTITRPTGPDSAEGGGGVYVSGKIEVGGYGEIDLTLKVLDNQNPQGEYIVCGLVFKERPEILAELPRGSGRDIFTEFTCDSAGHLTVHDAKTSSRNYDFLLLIQNTDGGVGVIDPQISNQ